MHGTTRLVAMLVLATSACARKEPSQSSTSVPGKEGAQEQGVTLRYATGSHALAQTTSFEMTQSGGGQYAEAKVDLTAKLAMSDQGDQVKVVWTIGAVEGVELQGAMKTDDGEDPGAFLVEHGKGAYLIDRRGQSDDAVSDALPENAKRKAELEALRKDIAAKSKSGAAPDVGAGPQVLIFLPPVFVLPTLPEATLTVGRAVSESESEEAELGDSGIVLPVEASTTHTLVKVDAGGASRVAEVRIEAKASGKTEVPGGEVSVDGSSEGTLLFDLDRGLPVSYEITRTETFAFGEVQGESTTIIHATWEPQ